MAPKAKAKKGGKQLGSAASAMIANAAPPKPKKIPPPPACFKPEDIARFQELYNSFDTSNIGKVSIDHCMNMLRKLGLNPKPAELKELFARFLEDDLVDTMEFHEFLFIIEGKMNFGDDVEVVVVRAMRDLGHDDEETGVLDFELFQQELITWADPPFEEAEFTEWIRQATRDKSYNPLEGTFIYQKFIDTMNGKDHRFFEEPINFFKLDQRTLAQMAIVKAQQEKEEQERKEAERLAREEAKRQRMIAEGLIQPD